MPELSFADYRAICETKARYCRCLDSKDWDGYADVFTEDIVLDTTASGGPQYNGRDEIVASVGKSLEGARTAHQVHAPEIILIDADNAEVIWAMQDRVVWSEARNLTGYGHYREHYRRCPDGKWRISFSALTRLHMDTVGLGG